MHASSTANLDYFFVNSLCFQYNKRGRYYDDKYYMRSTIIRAVGSTLISTQEIV